MSSRSSGPASDAGRGDAPADPTWADGADGPDGPEWIADLFGRHSGAVLGYARRRLSSAEDAEDVVVEVFATAWRRRADVPDPALPWLYATAAHVIAHVIRSDARRTRLGARLATVRPLHPEGQDHAEAVASATDARTAVAAAMDDLAESDAELLRLWAWEGLEPAEIAVVLDCSPGTARTRLHRARTRLRAALEARGVDDSGAPPGQRAAVDTTPRQTGSEDQT